MYVDLIGNETRELAAVEPYSLKLAVVAKSGPAHDEENRLLLASAFANDLGNLLERACWDAEKGEICLKVFEPLTEKDFSLYQLNRMLR